MRIVNKSIEEVAEVFLDIANENIAIANEFWRSVL